jgi:nitrite reductase (NADH) small subunit
VSVAERHAIGALEEFPAGSSRIVEVRGRSVGVFNIDGCFYAIRNVCPHHGAPLCRGLVTGRMLPSRPYEYEYGLEGKILRCPWHGYEFSLEDGRSVLHPETMRARSYRVEVDAGEVFVYA